MDVDESLLPFATDRQREAITAYIEHGSYAKAAAAIGIGAASCHNLIRRVKRKAGLKGSVPELGIDKPFPDIPHIATGYSRYFKTEDGGYWVKMNVEKQHYIEMLAEVAEELKESIAPLPPVTLSPHWEQPEELLNFYVLSDIHIGAYSWAEETGSAWNLEIAEQTIMASFEHLIQRSSPAKHGFFCQLGDALHYDGMEARSQSGHILDSGCRYHEMVRLATRVFRRVVKMLLEKHEHVTVLHAMGNHDPTAAPWLQELFAMHYEENDRCEVIVNPSPYYAHLHGKTFLGMHHGHRANMKKITEVFNGRRYWPMLGKSRMAYVHAGHQHHRELKEWNGGIVEMHPTLAAPSSYEAHGGWEADRSMACITYHTAGMEHSRVLFHPKVIGEGLPAITQTPKGDVSAA